MPIKDKEKAKEYKRLWIAKKRKGVASHDNVEPKKVFVEPLKSVEPKFVEPLNVEPVEPIKLKVEPETMSNPVEPCSRCQELENSISNFANLYYQEQDRTKEQKQINHQLEKKIKELNAVIIALNKDRELEFVKPRLNCEKLQWEVDSCNRLHKIPKDAEFIDLIWDKRHKKLVFYNCNDSCWTGKYCNNCSSLLSLERRERKANSN